MAFLAKLSAFFSASSASSVRNAFRIFALILISSNLAGERPRFLSIDARLGAKFRINYDRYLGLQVAFDVPFGFFFKVAFSAVHQFLHHAQIML